MSAQVFCPKEITTNREFVEEFERWKKFGRKVESLKKYEQTENLNPISSGEYLYQIFRNELKRHGQSSNLKELTCYKSFCRKYPQGLKFTFKNVESRIIQSDESVVILFPSFLNELAEMGWLLPWQEDKETISKKKFYWQLWKLFFFELRRQKVILDPLKRRQVFEKFWPSIQPN